MVPLVQWSPTMDASTAYGRLVDNLATCVGRPELFVTCGKAMAHLHVHSAVSGFPNYSKEYKTWCSWGDKSHFIRDAFTDAHRHHDQLKNLGNEGDRLKLQANARAALRTVVVYGWETCLSHPNEEELIWYGDLRWHHANGKTPSYEEFDWLIDYLVDRVPDETDDKTEGSSEKPDDETVGDALLALSGMHGLGSPTKRSSYVKALVRCMAPTRPSRVRHAALRAVSDAGEDLASIANDSMSQGLDATLLDELSRALSHQNSIPSSDFVDKRTCCYLQLISALTKNDEWCKRLTSDGLVEWCISSSLYDTVLASSMVLDKVFLTGILLHINPSGTDISPNPVQEKKWMLVNSAWAHRHSFNKERIEALPALVAVTRQNLPDFTRAELADLASAVHEALQSLKDRRRRGWLGRINVLLIDAALPIVQELYDELSPYAEHPSASQHNNGS
ncbi:hypothetical protein M405DRAFT_937920 [Rhizopogon salebrosus TDB-379]|nr:hypothetical protein M405DRAFT_937920 [Rhizopogon salebrosus TDB-379]